MPSLYKIGFDFNKNKITPVGYNYISQFLESRP